MSTVARNTYMSARLDLEAFCEEQVGMQVDVITNQYPVVVKFTPGSQMSIFSDPEENIDENGELNSMTVIVGLTTEVRSNLKFETDSKLLRKLIKKAEDIGELYYQAFVEGKLEEEK